MRELLTELEANAIRRIFNDSYFGDTMRKFFRKIGIDYLGNISKMEYVTEATLLESNRLLAASEARVRELTTWQPIETAPRDGARVLLVISVPIIPYPKGFEIVTASWCGANENEDSFGWWFYGNCYTHPLFWMPLPAHPTPEEKHG